MNIELTGGQLRRILKLVHLGNFVVNGGRAGDREDPRIGKYDEVEELLLRLAYENECDDLVRYDLKTNRYTPAETLEMDEEIEAGIDEYNEDVFWDELGSRLAERDIMEEMGEEVLSGLDDDERLRVLSEAKETYFDEFEENGVDNLRLVQNMPGSRLPVM